MEQSFLKQMSGFLRDKKNRKRYIAVFLCLALVVSLTTFVSLTMSGNAQNHMVKVLDCKYEAHKHTADCYDKEHPDQLICGYADYAVHIHNDDCYDASGVLVCQLPQIEPHTHDETCYTEEKTLTCELPESEGHVHTEACYTTEQGELTCTVEEHTHSEECYDENGEVICGKEEHTHNEACYEQIQTLTCEIPEGEGAHTHTDDCYVTEKKLTCGKLELHTHTEECYQHDENGKLVLANDAELVLDDEGNPVFDEEHQPIVICGIPVLEEHVHGADCFKTVELTDEEVDGFDTPETSQAPAESESCYDAEGNLTCTKEEHTHTEECYDEAAAEIVCGKEEHTHTAPAPAEAESCYDAEGNLICTKEEHTHSEECYGEDGALICEKEEHTHTAPAPAEAESCYDAEGNLTCTKEEHTHTEECYGEDGALICEKEEHTHTGAGESNEPEELTKTYQDSGVVITATYTEAANIPEEAELIAKAVTSETDPELYAQRMEEALQHVTLPEDAETPNMLLYNIGFYVNGEEVEPAAPVTITVQLLNAEGFAVGAPITVVHFADDGTEVLDGTALNENSETTFTTDGFSDYGIMPIDLQGQGYNNTLGDYITEADNKDVTYDPLTDEWSTSFWMNFTLERKDFAGDRRNFDYPLPDGIVVPDALLDKDGTNVYRDKQQRFSYTFEEKDGKYWLHVLFDEDDVTAMEGQFDCHLEFEASGHYDDDIQDEKFKFNDKVTVKFGSEEVHQKNDVSVRKKGEYDPKTKTLKYTVYVESKSGTAGDITVDDFLQWQGEDHGLKFGQLVEDSLHITKETYDSANPYNDNAAQTLPDEVKYELKSSEDGKFSMTLPELEVEEEGGIKKSTRYKITYEYELTGDVTAESSTTMNTVSASIPGWRNSASSTVTVEKDMVEKKVATDEDGYVVWTVYVNKAGVDIADSTLTDDFFKDLKPEELTIDPDNGGYTIVTDTDGKVKEINFNALEGSTENNTTYTITYKTKPDDPTQEVTNNVQFLDPHENPFNDTETYKPGESGTGGDNSPHVDKKEFEGFSDDKEVAGAKVAHWRVTFDVPEGGFQNGMTFTDVVGNGNNQHYMTYDQLCQLVQEMRNQGILEHTENWQVTCMLYDGHGGERLDKLFDPATMQSLDEGHHMGEDCQIMKFSFQFKKGWTPDKTTFTLQYETFIPASVVDSGEVWLDNTFNDASFRNKFYFDQVDKTDGSGISNNANIKVDENGTLVWLVTIKVQEAGHTYITVKDTLPVDDNVVLDHVDYTSTYNGTTTEKSWDANSSELQTGFEWTYDAATGVSELKINAEEGTTIPTGTTIVLKYTCKINDKEYLEKLKQGIGNGVEAKRFENTVEVSFGGEPKEDTDSQTVVGRTDGYNDDEVVTKLGSYDSANNLIEYQIDLNPTGANLVPEDSEPLHFTDTLDVKAGNQLWYLPAGLEDIKNQIVSKEGITDPALPKDVSADNIGLFYDPIYDLDLGSVAFYKAKVDDSGNPLRDGDGNLVPDTDAKLSIPWKYDSATHTITADIPDGQALVVQYNYSVRMRFYVKVNNSDIEYNLDFDEFMSLKPFNETWGEHALQPLGYDVTNTASLTSEQKGSSETQIRWTKSRTSADSSTNGAQVQKVDSAFYDETLSGAVFDLYEYNDKKDPIATGITTDKNGRIIVSYELNGNGNAQTLKFIFEGDTEVTTNSVHKGQLYYLKETKAPDGYSLPNEGEETIVCLWYPDGTAKMPTKDEIAKKLEVNAENVIIIDMTNPTQALVPNEKDDEPEYTLPETGGDSTHMYMLGGAMLLLLAAALAYKAKISGRRVFRG